MTILKQQWCAPYATRLLGKSSQEGQITEFKCPICDKSGEADLPYRAKEEKELIEEDLEVEEENLGDLDEIY